LEETGHNRQAKFEQKKLFPDWVKEEWFGTPKPEKLLKRIFDIATKSGDLVLDSFAGSGTTGAVAQKMGRRWIMVELGDHCTTHIVPRLAAETSSEVIDQTISIPRISLMPKGEVKAGFRPFKLDLSTMNLVAPDGALLARYLDRNEADTIGVIQGNFLEKTPEDYVVSGLINFPDVSYDDNADLLYDLAGQVVEHLRSRMEHNELMALLQAEQDAIARAVRAQMLNHYWIDDTVEYEAVVKQGFTEIRSSAHTSEKTEPLNYRSPPADKSNMARYLFGGYSKCLVTPVRFQSDTERKLSVILERESLKWFKPAKGQFQMFYRDGSDHQEYIPDFVAETESEILMLEPKMATKMQDSDVLAKRDVAVKWCQQASEHGISHGGKPWRYVLIPHDQIQDNMGLDFIVKRFGEK
jgi:type III restriction enzyme